MGRALVDTGLLIKQPEAAVNAATVELTMIKNAKDTAGIPPKDGKPICFKTILWWSIFVNFNELMDDHKYQVSCTSFLATPHWESIGSV